jgi:hypothetical protein
MTSPPSPRSGDNPGHIHDPAFIRLDRKVAHLWGVIIRCQRCGAVGEGIASMGRDTCEEMGWKP